MAILEKINRYKINKSFDITLFQTPDFGNTKGYKIVYRTSVLGKSHDDALYEVFRKFNVPDTMPSDYKGRFVTTGDIIFIDEGRRGHHYYRLEPDGWMEISRIHIMS